MRHTTRRPAWVRFMWVGTVALGLLCGAAATASAQAASPPPAQQGTVPSTVWRHGTTLNVFAGSASATGDTGLEAGGSAGWEVTPWVAIEGSAAWLRRARDAHGFDADLSGQLRILPPHVVVPFVRGGIGLYRATFDLTQGPLPPFYANRLNVSTIASTATFTDTSFLIGAGVDVFATPHIAIRPEVGAIFVRANGTGYTLGTFLVHLVYHIEQHPMG